MARRCAPHTSRPVPNAVSPPNRASSTTARALAGKACRSPQSEAGTDRPGLGCPSFGHRATIGRGGQQQIARFGLRGSLPSGFAIVRRPTRHQPRSALVRVAE